MMKKIRSAVFLAAPLVTMMLMLSSCSTHRQAPAGVADSTQQGKNWQARQQILAKRAAWALNGRASVTYRGENWPFGIQWQQQSPAQYRIQIKHPLTRNTLATIDKTARSVTLKANNRVYSDRNAESLIEKHLHVKLPVRGMQSWVLGIPSPAYPLTAVKLDSAGRPALLQQAGWTIHYSAYQGNGATALPGLIKISRTSPRPVQVKMRIRQWQ